MADSIGIVIKIAVQVFGGLGLFLYGMKMMGDGLEKTAGMRMQKIIEALTGNVFKGILVGTLVTGVIQSSSATTVMVVGFVSVGVMTLSQAAGVIMGANIGTTVTAHILRLSDIPENNVYLSLIKPDNLMFVLIIIGILLIFLAKKQSKRDSGEIFIGLAIIFAGMGFMTDGLKHIDQSIFKTMFSVFSGTPVLGILTGAVVTGIIQSSSASVGILQAVAGTGTITLSGAMPIILGQNIGTCVTAIISSIGATKTAKKAAVFHLLFNVIGTVIFTVVLYLIFPFVIKGWNSFAAKTVTSGDIANFHSIFNIVCTALMFPFVNKILKLINVMMKDEKQEADIISQKLDGRFLMSPAIALGQARDVITTMFNMAKENIITSEEAVLKKSGDAVITIKAIEKKVNSLETDLSGYLVKIADKELSERESKTTLGFMHIISDIERISDHSKNIAEIAENNIKLGTDFSQTGIQELKNMYAAIFEIINTAMEAIAKNDTKIAASIEPKEQVIDLFKETFKLKHLDRLTNKQCSVNSGVAFLDMINNLERVADHCSNIAVTILQINSEDTKFNPHDYIKYKHKYKTEDYENTYNEFMEKYYNPVV